MPSLSLERLLKQMLAAEHYRAPRSLNEQGSPSWPLVAISHDFGTWGEFIGRSLAFRLGVHFLGDDLTQTPRDKLHVEEILLRTLDERARQRRHHHTLVDFLNGSPTTMPTYRKHLIEALLLIAEREGGVIVDRGAHVFLRDRPILRVRLIGSLEVCAQRVAARESITLHQAKEKVERINRERRKYLRALVGQDMLDPSHFDLTLMTDRIQNPDVAADMLFEAMRAMGLPTEVVRQGDG